MDMPVTPDPTKYDKRVMPGQDLTELGINTTPEGIEAKTIIDPTGVTNLSWTLSC